MKRPTRAWRMASALAATALVLTACGGETETPAGNENTDSASPTEDESGGDTGGDSGAVPKGDGTLTFGSLLPQTGDLAFLGPPEFAGVDLAVEEINEAGGVLGKDVAEVDADSGDGTPDIAGAEVDKLLNANADVIIGAAASGVSITVIDKITGAGVVHFSPANTAAGFDTYDDNGLYFRTAPSDVLQGEILANLAIEDGHDNIAIMGRQDFYGEGLSERVQEVVEQKGATVSEFVLYAADAQNYTAEVAQVAASKPDALVLVAFEETTKIIPQLIAKGIGPQDIQIYFVDGNLADYSEENFDLSGVKGTVPGAAEPDPEFIKRVNQVNKPLDELTYAAESYDATIISALAAIQAGSDSGKAIGSEIVNVTKDGTECTTFADCVKLLDQGEDIDYKGPSGPTDMTDTGSLVAGTYAIQEYQKGNTYEQVDSVSGVVPSG
ncbi:MAG: Branched-chain amino acid ABC transporter, amino acid-binding protein [uncultured Nocardioidaceae bacterium]|uniref:Branched-chain amino acid ABC transporter, amino acid-binding protein n=1 Tax=uncultured Nocardioidaceae bacterium TaxID=253824 RepID=A0A6J4MLQ5_9ACTN|nr:MAG: Branched-chain amino acid ABC transporter, amino acid-binding protein [uncultured Nocardioidaceae bacterium]